MANLDTQIERTGKILNDIKEAIEGHGLDLEGVSPVNYSNKIKEIATVSVQEFGIRPVILFKRAETNPGKPIGGHWNVEDNSIEGVDGWYLDLEDDTTVSTTTLRTWMTTALFKTTDGSMFSNWTKPIQISGENGKDGARGEQGPAGQSVGLIQYFTTWVYYPSSKNEIIPSAPLVKYNKELGKLEDLTGGWQFDTKSPDLVTPSSNYIWWQSMLQYNSNSEEVIVTTPVRISAESTAVEGVTRYYLCKSENSIPQINADGWEVWTENSNVSPTYEKPYLFVRDSTKYGNTEINSKPWLLAVYTKGLMDIDLSYACLSSNIEITFIDDSGQSQTDVEMNVPQYISEDRWSQTSEAAISKEGYEFTSDYDYLFCRTIYKYHDGKTDCFYQIVSYYKEAEKAPILYSAGIYNEKSTYTKSNDQCPYIYYPKGLTLDDNDNISTSGKKYNYFYLMKESQPEEMDFESAYISGYWKKIDSFEAIYSDIGILKAAEVGNFVFDDKYMFSKFGVDNTGKESHYTEYSDWNVTPTVKEYEWNGSSKLESETERKGIAAAIEHGAFVPSTSINAVTGESWFANGNAHFEPNGNWKLGNDESCVSYNNDNKVVSLTGVTLKWEDFDNKEAIVTKTDLRNFSTEIGETYVTTNTFNTEIANVENLIAKKATIDELKAISSKVDNITANYITTSYLTSGNGTFKGKITATSGTIGGWDINSSSLSKQSATSAPYTKSELTSSKLSFEYYTKGTNSNALTLSGVNYSSLLNARGLTCVYSPDSIGSSIVVKNPSNEYWQKINTYTPVDIQSESKDGISINCSGGILSRGENVLTFGGIYTVSKNSTFTFDSNYADYSCYFITVNDGSTIKRGTKTVGPWSTTRPVFVVLTGTNSLSYQNL